MTALEQLARELALRDIENEHAPCASIEEMKTVLAALLQGEYERVYPEVLAAHRTHADPRCTCAATPALRLMRDEALCPIHGHSTR